MHALDDYGITAVLNPRRRVDWVEPHAEGDWELSPQDAGGDLER